MVFHVDLGYVFRNHRTRRHLLPVEGTVAPKVSVWKDSCLQILCCHQLENRNCSNCSVLSYMQCVLFFWHLDSIFVAMPPLSCVLLSVMMSDNGFNRQRLKFQTM